VGEYAILSGMTNVRVSGYGLVVGLGNRGDTSVPPEVSKYLVSEISRSGIGRWDTGTARLAPEKIIHDNDTAVVLVEGMVPSLAPAGTRFDLSVRALPHTETSTLDGGHLMDMRLYLSLGDIALPTGGTTSVARSDPMRGDTFVNPYLDPERDEDLLKFRSAHVPNGGVVTRSMPIRLELRQADWNRSVQIANAINTRFKSTYAEAAPAKARDNRVVDLRIPMQYRENYLHFLDLVMHLPLARGQGAWDDHAKKLIQYMESPGGDCHHASLVLEAMGRSILPIIKPAYISASDEAAYHCAVAGMRLGDTAALPVIVYHATKVDSPFRLTAIRELSKYPREPDARITLDNLLDDEKDLIRITAYESLVKLGRSLRIQPVGIADAQGRVRFYMDVIQTRGKYIVYATQTGQPRLALFGQNIPVEKNIFFRMPDGLVVINGKDEASPTLPVLGVNDPEARITYFPTSAPAKETNPDGTAPAIQAVEMPKGPILMIDRMVYRTNRRSDMFQVPANAKSLVQALGTPTDRDEFNQIRGLGLTYGQVVNVLYRMCGQGDIRAKFVLQDTPDIQKILNNASTMERPDTPE